MMASQIVTRAVPRLSARQLSPLTQYSSSSSSSHLQSSQTRARLHTTRSRTFTSLSIPPTSSSSSPVPQGMISVGGRLYPRDSWTNTTPTILSKTSANLHLQPSHPLSILRSLIESHFTETSQFTPLPFHPIIPPSPVVTVYQNFDELGFPPDHPGRSKTDSYYINETHMLRTHTSAHEVEAYKTGQDRLLISADVYRRDEIDASHYPVFHQMEGMCLWPSSDLKLLPQLNAALAAGLADCPLIIEDPTVIGESNPYQIDHDPIHAAQMAQHLKHSLNGLIFKLFGGSAMNGGEPLRVRWIEAYFPWTSPSYEVEVWFNGKWLEILGCGVVVQNALERGGVPHKSGWAFGLGLERIAMVLFSIPDIRLFWSTDPRFLNQFKPETISTFSPYSKYPPCYKDMSFWLPEARESSLGMSSEGTTKTGRADLTPWHENDYCEIVRDVAGDLIENVTLIDQFEHPKTKRRSVCYRLNYRSMDRSLSNDEVNALQEIVQKRVVDEMGIEMR